MTNQHNATLLSIPAVARQLGISAHSVRRLIEEEALVAVRVGSHRRVPTWSLNAFVGRPTP